MVSVLFPLRVLHNQCVNAAKQSAKLDFHEPGSDCIAPLLICQVNTFEGVRKM